MLRGAGTREISPFLTCVNLSTKFAFPEAGVDVPFRPNPRLKNGDVFA